MIGISTAVHNNPSSLKFLNTLQGNFLLQYVDTPTRGRGSDIPRILDLVISNTEISGGASYGAKGLKPPRFLYHYKVMLCLNK